MKFLFYLEFTAIISIKWPERKEFMILSLDGGGMRGLSTAVLLREIEKEIGSSISEIFDLIAGTSTGALLGGLFSLPDENGKPRYTGDEIVELYKNIGPEMFPNIFSSKISRFFNIFSSKYDGVKKRQMIKDIVGDLKLSDLRTGMLITSFDLNTLDGYSFTTKKATEANSKADYKLLDVFDATSAAPTYFPSVIVKDYDSATGFNSRNFVDGALVGNSPTMEAISYVRKKYGVEIDNIYVLSVGTGKKYKNSIAKKINRGGLVKWGTAFPKILIDSTASADNDQAYKILPSNHFLRVNFNITDKDKGKLDDARKSSLDYLVARGSEMYFRNRYDILKLLNFNV